MSCKLMKGGSTKRMSERKLSQIATSENLRFDVEIEHETDGRWIAEIPDVPGALAYGATKSEAIRKASAIVLCDAEDLKDPKVLKS